MRLNCARIGSGGAVAVLAVAVVSSASMLASASRSNAQASGGTALEAACTPENVQSAVSGLSVRVTIKPTVNVMPRPATRYVAASGKSPAFCQVTGTYVTNPATGKTANFIATLPEGWNGKYLQLGCSSHCGQFFVSDPAVAAVTVTAQGYPNQIIEKGYATFATDQGHEGLESASWALRDGRVDQDYLDDFYFRASKVLSTMGKQFTRAFYGRLNGSEQRISRAYFQGCSGGGRDAMVASSYFPEAFDGIIAGSPYNPIGVMLQASAIKAAASRSPDAGLTPQHLALFDLTVKAQCDGLDGARDGLIQNPAACNFVAERDLPRCPAGSPVGQCFSPAQIETISVITSAVTDERGNVVQPAYSVSELAGVSDMLSGLAEPGLKIMVHRNEPGFDPAKLFRFHRGGPGNVTAFHAVVSASEVAKVRDALRLGAGHLRENTSTLMRSKTKLMVWHNFSDELLTPYISVNWYKQLARDHGGYASVQRQARLFMLPGTTHCSITSVGPNAFDPLTAMENWVERGVAPDALPAWVADRQYTPGAPKAPVLARLDYTMPLCKFPEMARYSGRGDMKDGRNWTCRPGDTGLLRVGATGKQAGVLR